MKKNQIWKNLFTINGSTIILDNSKNTIDTENKEFHKKYIFFISKYKTKKSIKKLIENFFQINIQNIYFVKHLNKNFLNFNKVIVQII